MRKNDAYLFTMIGIFSLILGLVTIILTKFTPLLLNKTVYMCKSALASVTYREVPHSVLEAIVFMGIIYVGFTTLKILAAVYQYKKLAIKYNRSRKNDDERIATLQNQYPFLPEIRVVSARSSQAFSLGFLRRHIYISSSLINRISTKELEAIILHEYKHVKDFDGLKLFIAFIIETSLSFIPSMREFTISMRIDRELQADKFAVSIQKTNRHVLSSLKKILSSPNEVQPHFVPRFAAADLLDARIALLVDRKNTYKKSLSKMRLILSLFSLSFIAYLVLTPVHAAEILINGETSVMACSETSPQCLAVCEANASYLNKAR